MTAQTTDVFTPTTTARLTFVERDNINIRLVNALRTPGMQLVVFGRSGCGKTTLLQNKLIQVYEHHITSRCIVTTTIEELLLDAFDQLEPFFIDTHSSERTKNTTASLTATYKVIQASIKASDESTHGSSHKRMLPPQLTPSLLAKLIGEAKGCWVLEDFHKVTSIEKVKLAQIMKLFMDMASEYPATKIVAIGAVNSARLIVQADEEMWHRIAEIEVPLMTNQELELIMSKGEDLLRTKFDDGLQTRLKHLSNGLPAVIHQLCLNMCFNQDLYETIPLHIPVYKFSVKDFILAVQQWLEDSADSLRHAYDKAVRAKALKKYDNCRIVIHALAGLSPDGGTHASILSEITKVQPDYPPANLTRYLRTLQTLERGFAIVHDPTSGRYSFSSPMMHAFVRAIVTKEAPQSDSGSSNTTGQSQRIFRERSTEDDFDMAELVKLLYRMKIRVGSTQLYLFPQEE